MLFHTEKYLENIKKQMIKKIFLYISLYLAVLILSACLNRTAQDDIRISRIEQKIDKINQKIENLHHKISTNDHFAYKYNKIPANQKSPPHKKKILTNKPAKAFTSDSNLPANKLYSKAFLSFQNNEFAKARKIFQLIFKKYPRHNLAANSLYWTGECYYSAKQYNNAISIFKKIIKKYPKSRKVPDAMLKISFSYLSLKDTITAKYFLKDLMRNYPFSPAGDIAEKKLKTLIPQ